MTMFTDEVHQKQTDVDSKYVLWQRQYDENNSQLKQRVELCQCLDDKYKVVYEIDTLVEEIGKRTRTVPQTYKEALNRVDTVHEINRLYDVRSSLDVLSRVHVFFTLRVEL